MQFIYLFVLCKRLEELCYLEKSTGEHCDIDSLDRSHTNVLDLNQNMDSLDLSHTNVLDLNQNMENVIRYRVVHNLCPICNYNSLQCGFGNTYSRCGL